jgi:hypothetical protein
MGGETKEISFVTKQRTNIWEFVSPNEKNGGRDILWAVVGVPTKTHVSSSLETGGETVTKRLRNNRKTTWLSFPQNGRDDNDWFVS